MFRPFLTSPIFCILSLMLLLPARSEETPVPEKIEYNRDVRPILGDSCFKCHGFDKNHRKGDRRIDTREGALADIDGIKAIVPGDLKASELYARIHSDDEEEVMPPPKDKRQLTVRQKAILSRWIEQGAEYQDHWAYIKPTKPTPPDATQDVFTKNSIDRFVLARQIGLGLKPGKEADRTALYRRLSFDLLGLPPKPEEVAAFVQDNAADAYEKLVEKLLASPHYGERMAVYWLDLVRFADTAGYHSDNPRNIWPYRDWVINSFNENKRFDQFTIEQIAGDMLPNSTKQQKIASAFNRLNMTTEEGGAQPKQYESKTVTDRVKTVGTVWLAQTYMCNECHDHKFDPVTAKDFYRIGAFFADIKEETIGRREQGIIVAPPELEKKLNDQSALVDRLNQTLVSSTPEIKAAQEEWEKETIKSEALVADWTPILPTEKPAAENKSVYEVKQDILFVKEAADKEVIRIKAKIPLKHITAFRLDALADPALPASGPGRASNGNFRLSEFSVEQLLPDGKLQPVVLQNATATFDHSSMSITQAIDGVTASAYENGWGLTAEEAGKDHTACFETQEPLTGDGEINVVFTLRFNYGGQHLLGKFKLAATTTEHPVRAPGVKGAPHDVMEYLAKPASERTPDQVARIEGRFREITPLLNTIRQEHAEAKIKRDELESQVARCIVSERNETPRVVRVLPRGDWMNETGEIVKPGVPAHLPQPAVEGRDLNRLDLAQWLVSRDNPLTARVFVNRLWKMFYGVGLSKTLEDMGTQGEWPAQQPLLDWLACEFMESGWDVKHVVRLMVSSGTYRLVSQTTPEIQEHDPFNRELTHQSPFRLDAEFVRDNALAISGLLKTRIGGPSVKPYQPAGYWENLNFPAREWANDQGENQWRRGLYTWWQRSYLQPSMLAFDAPSREECSASRVNSNIPQQALALLNDPTYVEAARAFAARIMQEGGSETDARIAWACKQALVRDAQPDEIQILRALFEKQLAIYTKDEGAAQEILKIGQAPVPQNLSKTELAAWTSVARAILNLHETITRF